MLTVVLAINEESNVDENAIIVNEFANEVEPVTQDDSPFPRTPGEIAEILNEHGVFDDITETSSPNEIIFVWDKDADTILDRYENPIDPTSLRNRVVFNSATRTYMWNNILINREEIMFFLNPSILSRPVESNEHRLVTITPFSMNRNLGTLWRANGTGVFHDRVLAQAVADVLNWLCVDNWYTWTVNSSVTQENLNTISWIHVAGGTERISDIQGIQNLANLQSLYLPNNRISDLSPLSDLENLMTLDLSNNRIICIDPLNGMENLGWLNLNNNDIDCIEALFGMFNLWLLWLDNNRIVDVFPLSGTPNLRELFLRNNQVSDISSLPDVPWWDLHLCGNRISDISSLAESGMIWFMASNQTVIQRVSFAAPLIVQNVVRDTSGNFIAPSSSFPQLANYNNQNGEIIWHVQENQWSATYSWNHDPSGWGWSIFSGTVTVQFTQPVVSPTRSITVFPTVDLFVRNDTGLFPRESNTYTYRRHNGLERYAGADLQIGTNHAASNERGAYRESIVRFDLTPEQIDRIKNASGVGDDRVFFELFLTETHGNAQTREINLHLLPGYRAKRVHTNYPRWTLDGDNVARHTAASGAWMSAWDAYRARITARENFRNINPSAISDPIFFNHPQHGTTRLNEFFEFDLTDALKVYFNNNPNATSFAFVLSNLNENGLVVAASSRQTATNLHRRPRLILPVNAPQVIETDPVTPTTAVFVRNDTGSRARMSTVALKPCNHLDVIQTNTHLVIGSSNHMNASNGAYRETFMRFDLTAEQMDSILNASGVGNDRAVLNLGILRTDDTPATVRAINVHFVPISNFDRMMNEGPHYLSAFNARITARDFLRNEPVVAHSEYIFTRPSGVHYTRMERYFEIDLTAALQSHFRNRPAGISGSFAIVLSSLQGYDLVVAAGLEHDTLAPKLMVPAGGAGRRRAISFTTLNRGDVVAIPIAVPEVARIQDVEFVLRFNEADFRVQDIIETVTFPLVYYRKESTYVVFRFANPVGFEGIRHMVGTVNLIARRAGAMNVVVYTRYVE